MAGTGPYAEDVLEVLIGQWQDEVGWVNTIITGHTGNRTIKYGELKKIYVRAITIHHPDKRALNPHGNTEIFKNIIDVWPMVEVTDI